MYLEEAIQTTGIFVLEENGAIQMHLFVSPILKIAIKSSALSLKKTIFQPVMRLNFYLMQLLRHMQNQRHITLPMLLKMNTLKPI